MNSQRGHPTSYLFGFIREKKTPQEVSNKLAHLIGPSGTCAQCITYCTYFTSLLRKPLALLVCGDVSKVPICQQGTFVQNVKHIVPKLLLC